MNESLKNQEEYFNKLRGLLSNELVAGKAQQIGEVPCTREWFIENRALVEIVHGRIYIDRIGPALDMIDRNKVNRI